MSLGFFFFSITLHVLLILSNLNVNNLLFYDDDVCSLEEIVEHELLKSTYSSLQQFFWK